MCRRQTAIASVDGCMDVGGLAGGLPVAIIGTAFEDVSDLKTKRFGEMLVQAASLFGGGVALCLLLVTWYWSPCRVCVDMDGAG